MDFKKIEEKWQNIWEQEKRFEVKNHEPNKENAYILIEFPILPYQSILKDRA